MPDPKIKILIFNYLISYNNICVKQIVNGQVDSVEWLVQLSCVYRAQVISHTG